MNDDPSALEDQTIPPEYEDPRETKREWIILWAIWGLMVGSLVAWLDQSLLLGLPWLVAGILIGCFGWTVLMWLSMKAISYFGEYQEPMPAELLAEMEASWESGDETPSDEQRRWSSKLGYYLSLSMPSLAAFIFGVLVGPLPGALFALMENPIVSGTAGALIGIGIGCAVFAFLCSGMFAWFIRSDEKLSADDRWTLSLLMFVSPFLMLPFFWYCLRELFSGERPADGLCEIHRP